MKIIFSAIIFLLGLAVGSLINYFATYLITNKKAGKVKKYFLQLFAFCKQKLTGKNHKTLLQNLAVEISAGIIFVLIFFSLSPVEFSVNWFFILLIYFIFGVGLILIFLIDLKSMYIFDIVVLPLIPVAFLFNWWQANFDLQTALLLLLAGGFGALFYGAQYILSGGRWVGIGDIKLAVLLGVMLGIWGLMVCLLLAYISGAIIALILIILKKKKLTSQLPMAVFLAPAALIVLLLL